MKKTSVKALLTLALLALCVSAPAQQAEKPENFDKVLKKKYQTQGKSDEQKLEILKSKFSNWGIDPDNQSSIHIKEAWKNFEQKENVVVAVIDTGIDPKHPFLQENLHVLDGKASVMNFGVDFSKDNESENRPNDSHGHGTHVAGIIKSVFPKVNILTLKYYNPKASGQENLDSTIEALRYAVENDVDIINYSGGGPEPSREELQILRKAEKKGILVVAAAGNEDSDIDDKTNAYYPASYGLSNTITVTAHNKNLKMLGSSNYGKRSVHLSAPGHRIKSSLPQGRAGYLTGTSQATAFVSGVAALIKSNYPELGTKELKKIIVSSAKQEITLLKKCKSGGRLDATKAFKLAKKYNNDKKSLDRNVATNRGPDSVVSLEKKRREKKQNQGKIRYLKAGEPVKRTP